MSEEPKEAFLRLAHSFRKFHTKLPVPADIPPGEFFTLMRIWKNLQKSEVSDRVSVSCIHHGNGISMPALSQILGSLEKKGYIARGVDPSDRRKVSVTLTRKGEALLMESQKEMDAVIERFVEQFGQENFRQLCQLSEKMNEIMRKMDEERLWDRNGGA